jgi:DNA-binding NarL/FixJ family response regulator
MRWDVFILEDNARALELCLEGLALFARQAGRKPEVMVSGRVAEAHHLLNEMRRAPQLAIIDLGLPDGWGHEIIAELHRLYPETSIVVSTVFDDDGNLIQALKAGATGYLLKDDTPDEMCTALLEMESGRPPLSPAIARRILGQFTQQSQVTALPITPREMEVVRLLARGFTNLEVAGVLEISAHTVSSHIKSVYRKLHVSSRAELTAVLGASRPPNPSTLA